MAVNSYHLASLKNYKNGTNQETKKKAFHFISPHIYLFFVVFYIDDLIIEKIDSNICKGI